MTAQTAVITGAGGGLGRVFAQALAARGWRIIALGRTATTLQGTLDSLPGEGHKYYICDISSPDEVHNIFVAIATDYTSIDMLINNAGIPGPTGIIDSLPAEEILKTINTNFLGTMYCSQEAFSLMKRSGGGRIINNGSIAAHAPRAGAAAYAASKAAVASLTTSLSLEGREYNITATQLDIGNARTDLLGTFTSSEPMFDAHHAGEIIASIAALPLEVSADHVTLTASGMPYLGRG